MDKSQNALGDHCTDDETSECRYNPDDPVSQNYHQRNDQQGDDQTSPIADDLRSPEQS